LLIDRLATLLPSDTFLNRLEISVAEVRLSGVSADAPALIGMLEAEEGLAEVSFGGSRDTRRPGPRFVRDRCKAVVASGEGGS
jgi:general secretion pathway protein L